MNRSQNKTKLLFGFIIISAVFLFLRLNVLGHLLVWDEAWNILSLKAYLANDASNPFYWFYKFHPPVYMVFGKFLMPFQAGIDIRLQGLSLFFSYATLIVVYLFSARIGGWRYAWLSGIVLSFMPASIAYDTWIKRDPLAAFAGYTALFLLSKRKFLWCGAALALSLLSKESGIFFVLAAFLMVFILKEKRPFIKIFSMSLVITLLASWWYLFFSEMTTHGISFFFSKADYSMLWANSSLYYLKKLTHDLGWGIFLAIIGVCVIFYKTFWCKQPRWFFPVSVFLCVYLPISLLFVIKTPWLSIPAYPAIAMIAGSGVLWILKSVKKHKPFIVIFFVLLILVVSSGMRFSYSGYHSATYPNGWPGAKSSRDIALYLNKNMKPGDKFLITEFEYWKMPLCTVFGYYSTSTPERTVKGDEEIFPLMEEISRDKISWLVIIDSPKKESSTRALAEEVREHLEENPQKVGWGYIWNVEKVWKKD